MKVLEQFIMPDGARVRLEDWRSHNSPRHPDLYGYTIAAYPTALRGEKHLVSRGEPFRLEISHNRYAGYMEGAVLQDYAALKCGEKSLQNLAEHFYNGERDKWYLGMESYYRPRP